MRSWDYHSEPRHTKESTPADNGLEPLQRSGSTLGEASFHACLEAMPVSVFALSRNMKSGFANKQARDLLGIDDIEKFRIEDLTTSCDVFEAGSDHPYPLQRIPLIRALGGEVACVEDLEIERDGARIPLSVWGSPLLDDRGEVVAALAVFVDISERRSLERQLWAAQKMEAIGRVAGGVAHDFNNLLTVMKGYGEMVQRELGEDHPLSRSAADLRTTTKRAETLTRQLLTFARQPSGSPRVIDLNESVREEVSMLRRLIGENVTLDLSLGDNPGSVVIDPCHLSQVFLNLAVNARDAMPTGGALNIETAAVDISDAYAASHLGVKPGPYVRFSFSDNGCGMSPEVMEKIFEPFFTTKGISEGTGLGLATVYGIVNRCGGTIWVYSEPGEGTTFKIYLPRIDAREEKRPEAGQRSGNTPASPTGKETILLVEDEDAVRSFAVAALRKMGYKVLEAATSLEALLHCERHPDPIPLMMTDVVLPEISGPRLSERARELHPEMAVLFMSGYTADSIHRHGLDPEEIEFIEKPFGMDTLGRKVREILDRTPEKTA